MPCLDCAGPRRIGFFRPRDADGNARPIPPGDLMDDSRRIEKSRQALLGHAPSKPPSPCLQESQLIPANKWPAASLQPSSQPRCLPKHSAAAPGGSTPSLVAVRVMASSSPTTAGTCCSHRKAPAAAVFTPQATRTFPLLRQLARSARPTVFFAMPGAPNAACSPSLTPAPCPSTCSACS